MHSIDLGDEIVINVKYAGQEYSLREPTVGEIDKFREKGTEEKASEVLIELLETLGMPKETVLKMGMSKAKQLVDGLMDVVTKKK